MNEVFLLCGDNNYLIKKRINEILTELNGKFKNNVLIREFYISNLSDFEKDLSECFTLPLFNNHIVHKINLNIKILKEHISTSNDRKILINNISSLSTLILVFAQEKLDLNMLNLIKESEFLSIFSNSVILEEYVSPKYWQKAKLKDFVNLVAGDYGMEFTNEALDLFVECFKDNINFIESEINKLKTYLYPQKSINLDVIRDFYIENINADKIYFLTLNEDKKQINQYILSQRSSLSSLYILAVLQNKFRNALKIKMLHASGFNINKISPILNMHSYKIKKEIDLLKTTSIEKLKNIVLSLSQIEFKIKSGIIKERDLLKQYVFNLAYL